MPTVLYDTSCHRGWMIDAERAVLQLLLHRSMYYPNLFEKVHKFYAAVPDNSMSVRHAMRENGGQIVREDRDLFVGEKQAISFSREVKNLWEKLGHLARTANNEYRKSFHLSDIGLSSRAVYGFEYNALVGSSGLSEQFVLRQKLVKGHGHWPDLVGDLGSLILFGKDFGDLIQPASPVCPNFQSLPSGSSFLAADARLIHRILQEHRHFRARWRLTSSNMTWIATTYAFENCCHQTINRFKKGIRCTCNPVQELKRTDKHDNKPNLEGEKWKNGALIFGERRAALLKRSITQDQTSENRELAASPSLNSAKDESEQVPILLETYDGPGLGPSAGPSDNRTPNRSSQSTSTGLCCQSNHDTGPQSSSELGSKTATQESLNLSPVNGMISQTDQPLSPQEAVRLRWGGGIVAEMQ